VISDVIFHDHSAQTLNGPAQGGHKHQHFRTTDFGLQRPLHRFDLSFDATDAGNELGVAFDRMCHVSCRVGGYLMSNERHLHQPIVLDKASPLGIKVSSLHKNPDATAAIYVRFTSILLKNSQIEQLRKSRSCAHSVI
jgi:hypothetical protein